MTPLGQSATAILERLVAFDTVSRNSNLKLIGWVKDYLLQHGVAPAVIPNADGTKANLFATIGPAGQPGVLLSGHTDVVPVDGQSWRQDPFRLTEADGRLYGRGTSDMKGYVACILAIVPALARAALRRPVHLALSYDEELGCFGVPGIVGHMQTAGVRPAIAFIGEPSRMQVVNGHKGSCGMLTTVTGLTCHSSRPDLGVSAVAYGMDIIALLRRRADALAATPDSVGVFMPPYTTIGVGTVRGGTMRNSVPAECRIEWDIRATRAGMVDAVRDEVAAYVVRDVLPAMRARHPGCTVVTETIYDVPPLLPETDGAAEALALRLSGTHATATVPYGSEAGMFQQAGMSTAICGPGDIAQAHTADEWIAVAEIEACMAFLDRLAEHAGVH